MSDRSSVCWISWSVSAKRFPLEQSTLSTIDQGMEASRAQSILGINVSQILLALALLAVSLKSEILQAHEMPLYYHYIASLGNGAEPAESQSRGRSGFNASEFANIVLGNAQETRCYTDTLALLSAVML